MLVKCWAIVYDAGPTFNQHWIEFLTGIPYTDGRGSV